MWATALAVTIGVGVTVAVGGLIANQKQTFRNDFRSFADSNIWVQSAGAARIAVQPVIPFDWAPAIAKMPGVRAVIRDEAAYVDVNGEEVVLQGVDPGTNTPFFRHAGRGADRALHGDGVVVSRYWAARHHLRVGDVVALTTPAGRQTPPIVAIADTPNPAQGEIGLDLARYVAWYRTTGLTDLEVITDPRATPAVMTSISRLSAMLPVKLGVYTGEQILAGSLQSLAQITAIFNAMILATILATSLAVLNTMAIAVIERRRELGILRAVGTSRAGIRRIVLTEAAAITIAGLVGGSVMGLLQQVAGVHATGTVSGFTVDYRFVFGPLLTAAVAAIAMTVLGAALPAWRASKVDVVAAIGYE
jgi:putative ABC transport system permease protein